MNEVSERESSGRSRDSDFRGRPAGDERPVQVMYPKNSTRSFRRTKMVSLFIPVITSSCIVFDGVFCLKTNAKEKYQQGISMRLFTTREEQIPRVTAGETLSEIYFELKKRYYPLGLLKLRCLRVCCPSACALPGIVLEIYSYDCMGSDGLLWGLGLKQRQRYTTRRMRMIPHVRAGARDCPRKLTEVDDRSSNEKIFEETTPKKVRIVVIKRG